MQPGRPDSPPCSSPQMALHSQLEVEAKEGDGGGLVKKRGAWLLSASRSIKFLLATPPPEGIKHEEGRGGEGGEAGSHSSSSCSVWRERLENSVSPEI